MQCRQVENCEPSFAFAYPAVCGIQREADLFFKFYSFISAVVNRLVASLFSKIFDFHIYYEII